MSHNRDDLDDEDEFALTDLLPQYFALCRRDLEHVRKALQNDNLDDIRIVGHNLKGSGGAYGFPELSGIGLAMETAAKAGNRKALERQIEELADFLRAHA
jgi:HPt (histidine-containing phosphotransfer) domain-containing protein